MRRPRLLGVLLCYNDADILPDCIEHLLNNNHDLVVWNHGSTDETAQVLERYRPHLRELREISRRVDFYDLYPMMSRHLMREHVAHYDWISWPDQDEILEGPTRDRPYAAHLEEALDSPYSWIEFNDFLYWFTADDDSAVASPCARLRHYSLARHGAVKIRSWRASATNIRWFNHNRTQGHRHPVLFNLRHYPMRTPEQMQRRLSRDRANLQHGPVNFHYENMKTTLRSVAVTAADLHFDDGIGVLDPTMKFDWARIYGKAPRLPRKTFEAYVMTTRRWEIAQVIKNSLSLLVQHAADLHGPERIAQWLAALEQRIECPVLVALKSRDVTIVTQDLVQPASIPADQHPEDDQPAMTRTVASTMRGIRVFIRAEAGARRIAVAMQPTVASDGRESTPLLALVPCYGGEPARITTFSRGQAEFRDLKGQYYYLASEPEAPCSSTTDAREHGAPDRERHA
jgi:glycosyltransferase involved in cell wall biosynthesis